LKNCFDKPGYLSIFLIFKISPFCANLSIYYAACAYLIAQYRLYKAVIGHFFYIVDHTIKQPWEEYDQDLKPRTRESYKTHLKHILEHFKPKTQLHTIDYMKAKAFRDGLCSGEFSTSGKALSANRINNYASRYGLKTRMAKIIRAEPFPRYGITLPC